MNVWLGMGANVSNFTIDDVVDLWSSGDGDKKVNHWTGQKRKEGRENV